MGGDSTAAEDVVGEGERLDEADSTGGGAGAPVAGGEEPEPIGGGAVVAGAPGPGAGPPEGRELVPGAAALEGGALGTADEGAPLGVGAVVELPFNPAPPPNLPAKHCVMSGTSVSPVGTSERT